MWSKRARVHVPASMRDQAGQTKCKMAPRRRRPGNLADVGEYGVLPPGAAFYRQAAAEKPGGGGARGTPFQFQVA